MGYLKSNVILIIIMIILLLSSIFLFINCPGPVEPGQPGTKGPEINVKYGLVNIACDGSCDLGGMVQGTTEDVIFTIQNLGTADLILADNPDDRVVISGEHASMFTVTAQPSSSIIPPPPSPNNSEDFIIQFTPTELGLKTAEVTIPNNDSDGVIFVADTIGLPSGFPSSLRAPQSSYSSRSNGIIT